MRNEKESISNSFIKRIFGFSMASWVNCLISFIATPITTALFAPSELGKINLFVSYINILVPFAYMGFDQAYVRFCNEPCGKNTAKSLFRLCLHISLILSAAVVAVIVGFGKRLSYNIVGNYSFAIVIAFCVYFLATVLLRYTGLKARMENNVKDYFVQAVSSTTIMKLSFAIVALQYPKGEIAIIFKAALLFFCALFFGVRAYIKCKGDKCDSSKPVMTELSRFAIPLFPTVFLSMLNTSLPQVFLKRFVDYEAIGIYSNAGTIAGIITILQSGLNTFWTPFVYEYYKQREKIQKMHRMVSFVLIAFALVLIVCKDLVYYILVDKQYWASKLIMPMMLISPVCVTIAETLGMGIELSKKTYLKLPVYCVNIAVNVGACVILIPQFGMVGAAIASALAALSMLIVKTIIGERFYKCSDNYTALVLGMAILLAVSAIGCVAQARWIGTIAAWVAILALCLVYRRTLKELIAVVKGLIEGWLGKRNAHK